MEYVTYLYDMYIVGGGKSDDNSTQVVRPVHVLETPLEPGPWFGHTPIGVRMYLR